MSSSVRNIVLWAIILCLVVLVWAVFKSSKMPGATPTFSELVKDVKDGKVDKITVNSITVTGANTEIIFHPLPQDDPTRRRPDITRARQLLDWEPQIKLREGLEKSLAYFQTCIH